MALTARHRFIISRLEEALLPGRDELVETLLRNDQILLRINSLFSPEGLDRIIFTYYSPDDKNIPDPRDEEKEEKASDPFASTDITSYAMAGNIEVGWLLVTQGNDIAVEGRAGERPLPLPFVNPRPLSFAFLHFSVSPAPPSPLPSSPPS